MVRMLTLLCVLFPIIIFAHMTPAATTSNTLVPVLKKVTPSVVNISVIEETMRNVSDLLPVKSDEKVPVKSYAVGSGVIFDAQKGLIVTNAHVVKDQKIIVVTLKNGERYRAKLLGKDDQYDIAILQIHATNLTALSFANSDSLQVGEFVVAVGSPYGLSQTVTSGMISALNRTHPQIEGYQSFIQTDAPINPGNSGGALIDAQGDLVGINTALVGPTEGSAGIGFAIPSNMVKNVIDQLLQYGKVEHGVLGVIVQNVTAQLQNAFGLKTSKGALVSQVLPNTPAAAAGIEPKDVITEVDQHPVHSAEQLRNVLGLVHPGTPVKVMLLRNNQPMTITVAVTDPKSVKQTVEPYIDGMRLEKVSGLQKNGKQINGLMLVQLSDGCAGALAGFQPGDVITNVNGKVITDAAELKAAIAHETKPLLFTATRSGNNFYLVVNRE